MSLSHILRSTDTLLVRKDEKYRSALGLSKRISKRPDEVAARIVYWKTVKEIEQVLSDTGFISVSLIDILIAGLVLILLLVENMKTHMHIVAIKVKRV